MPATKRRGPGAPPTGLETATHVPPPSRLASRTAYVLLPVTLPTAGGEGDRERRPDRLIG
jgi:hypothetical protein